MVGAQTSLAWITFMLVGSPKKMYVNSRSYGAVENEVQQLTGPAAYDIEAPPFRCSV